MSGKSFKVDRTPIIFDVDGEEFTARKMPGGLFVEFTRRAKTAEETEQADMLYEGFQQCMEPQEFERFWKLCTAELDIYLMMEIFQHLARESANARPTKPSSPSATGRRRVRAVADSSEQASG